MRRAGITLRTAAGIPFARLRESGEGLEVEVLAERGRPVAEIKVDEGSVQVYLFDPRRRRRAGGLIWLPKLGGERGPQFVFRLGSDEGEARIEASGFAEGSASAKIRGSSGKLKTYKIG